MIFVRFLRSTSRTPGIVASLRLQSSLFVSLLFAALGGPLIFSGTAVADDQDYVSEIAHLDLQDLLSQEVTSVMRKEQLLSQAPAAIYVLTGEDIRRVGATSIPEALRLVPGLTVIQSGASSWSVTARGFDSNGAAKLLVLIDGRSVYTPLFSGVFWDVQDVILEDIDRIEVIRGPGAVSWGENAVNGVINIITKSAKETQGFMAKGMAGKEQQLSGSVRYGGEIDKDTQYKIYTKAFKRDDYWKHDNSGSAQDGWDMVRGGFRIDSKTSARDSVTVQGDIYGGNASQEIDLLQSFAPPFTETIKDQNNLGGGNILARFTRDYSETSQLTVQAYYDRTQRHTDAFAEDRDTFDLDVQHHIRLNSRNDLVYGGDFRVSTDSIKSSPFLNFDPANKTDTLVTGFVQDEITIIPKTFSITPGTKIGYNSYSGFEYQPAIKSAWTPNTTNTLWGSISRAVRIPARIDQDFRANGTPMIGPGGIITVPALVEDGKFDSEKLLAYEMGYRVEPFKDFSLDVATFYHHYSDLISAEPQTPFLEVEPGPPHLVLPFLIQNQVHGDTFGVEVATTWKIWDNVAFYTGYSYTEVQLQRDSSSNDTAADNVERQTPFNQATARLQINLPWSLQLDPTVYYVDSAPSSGAPSYIRTDLRLGWKANENWTFDLIGQNLFDNKHFEGPGLLTRTDVQRAIFGRFTFRYR